MILNADGTKAIIDRVDEPGYVLGKKLDNGTFLVWMKDKGWWKMEECEGKPTLLLKKEDMMEESYCRSLDDAMKLRAECIVNVPDLMGNLDLLKVRKMVYPEEKAFVYVIRE